MIKKQLRINSKLLFDLSIMFTSIFTKYYLVEFTELYFDLDSLATKFYTKIYEDLKTHIKK